MYAKIGKSKIAGKDTNVVRYPYGIMICIYLDNKFDWSGLAYGLVYSILVAACGRIGQEKIGKPMKNMMRIALKGSFSWLW